MFLDMFYHFWYLKYIIQFWFFTRILMRRIEYLHFGFAQGQYSNASTITSLRPLRHNPTLASQSIAATQGSCLGFRARSSCPRPLALTVLCAGHMLPAFQVSSGVSRFQLHVTISELYLSFLSESFPTTLSAPVLFHLSPRN